MTAHRTIEHLIKSELDYHPQSQLQDIYKLVFQAIYGPNHLIADRHSAFQYLLNELNSNSLYTDLIIQDLTWQILHSEEENLITCNYCRVSLELISKGDITFNRYLDLFIRSAKVGNQYHKEQWLNVWKFTEEYVTDNKLIDFCKEQSQMLYDLIEKDNPIVHHSDIYRRTYNPHYRLICKKFISGYIKHL